MSEDTTITVNTTDVAPAAPKRPRGRPKKVAGTGDVEGVKKIAPRAEKLEVPSVVVAPKREPMRASNVSPMDYIFVVGRRKRAVARVFLYKEGKGEIEINGQPFEKYFSTQALQETVRVPLDHSPFKKSVRIVAKVRGGGTNGQAGAVRLGIARGLLKLDETLRATFRPRGYLTRDSREKERKKPGLKKARKGPQWAKR